MALYQPNCPGDNDLNVGNTQTMLAQVTSHANEMQHQNVALTVEISRLEDENAELRWRLHEYERFVLTQRDMQRQLMELERRHEEMIVIERCLRSQLEARESLNKHLTDQLVAAQNELQTLEERSACRIRDVVNGGRHRAEQALQTIRSYLAKLTEQAEADAVRGREGNATILRQYLIQMENCVAQAVEQGIELQKFAKLFENFEATQTQLNNAIHQLREIQSQQMSQPPQQISQQRYQQSVNGSLISSTIASEGHALSARQTATDTCCTTNAICNLSNHRVHNLLNETRPTEASSDINGYGMNYPLNENLYYEFRRMQYPLLGSAPPSWSMASSSEMMDCCTPPAQISKEDFEAYCKRARAMAAESLNCGPEPTIKHRPVGTEYDPFVVQQPPGCGEPLQGPANQKLTPVANRVVPPGNWSPMDVNQQNSMTLMPAFDPRSPYSVNEDGQQLQLYRAPPQSPNSPLNLTCSRANLSQRELQQENQ